MTEPTPATRRGRRVAEARSHRRIAAAALAALLLLVVAGLVVALSGGGSSRDVAAAPPTTTTTTIPPPATAAGPPAAWVATSKVPMLQVFDAPGSTTVLTSFSDQTDFLAPRTLLVTERRGDWLKALLPMRPNETEGWIRPSDVTLSQNPYKITVDVGQHELVFSKDGREILRSPVVVGRSGTPTPRGTFYITDPVDLRDRPGGAYGAFALGLSGYSEVLTEFNGGPGQIAIHGTNQPELMGQDASAGCVRVPNDVIVTIATQAPLGTPVVIS